MDARTSAVGHVAGSVRPDEANAGSSLTQAATTQARTESELRASEERLRLAVAATGLGIFDWDLTTDLVTVNARFREMFALPPGGDVIGAAMLGGVVHPEDQAYVGARLGEAFKPGSSGAYKFEHRAVTPNGEIWLLTFGQVYFAGEGHERRAVRVIGNDLDISEPKRAEAERERLFAELQEQALELELSNEQLQDQALELELSNQQLQDQAAELELQAEEQQVVTEELAERTEAADLARAEAEAGRERTAAVLASIADAFYLLDRDWHITHVNDAAEPLLQTTRDQLVGRTLWEAFPGVLGSVFEGPYREAMETGRVTSAEAYFEPLGTWFDVRSYPWTGGLMVHFRDIGARKAAEVEREHLLAQLQKANTELQQITAEARAAQHAAEAANSAKSEFLSTMSHELRTPLNAIAGYTQLLTMDLRGPLSDAQRQDLERIDRASQHLMGLVTDVLNFARLDAGRLEFNIEDVELADVVGDLEPLLGPQFSAKGVAFDHDGCASDTPDRPHVVRADPEKFRQILLNLLTNAVKFTEAGGRVSLACVTDAAAGVLRVRVTDTGRGIAREQFERIFEPFVQVDRHRTQGSQQGVGLGLAISRDLARRMGGDLTVESTPGVGSSFTLTLPTPEAAGHAGQTESTPTSKD